MKLVILHLLRVLATAGSPFASALAWSLRQVLSSLAFSVEIQRVSSSLIGWQGQRMRGLQNVRRWQVTLGLVIGLSVLVRLARTLCAAMSHAAWRLRSIQQRMNAARSFDEWEAYASDLDAIRDERKRPHERTEKHFDEKLLSAKVKELSDLKSSGRVEELQFALRADLYRDFGNVTNKFVLICSKAA